MGDAVQSECARTTLGLAVSFSANLAVSYAFFNWTPTLLIGLHVPLNVALSGLFYFNLSGAIGTVLVARMMMRWDQNRDSSAWSSSGSYQQRFYSSPLQRRRR